MKTHQMQFQNPKFHRGTNITVRRGDKWFRALSAGDFLDIGEKHLAVVLGTAMVQVDWMPDEWLGMEHDPACRTRSGLLAVLQEVYPEFAPSEHVTVVFFSPALPADEPLP